VSNLLSALRQAAAAGATSFVTSSIQDTINNCKKMQTEHENQKKIEKEEKLLEIEAKKKEEENKQIENKRKETERKLVGRLMLKGERKKENWQKQKNYLQLKGSRRK